MPNSMITEVSEKTGLSVKHIESIWNKVLTEAKNKDIENKYAYAAAVLEHLKSTNDDAKNNFIEAKEVATDAESQRYTDKSGFLVCPNSVITGDDVAKYFGKEIPNGGKLGLEPYKLYNVYRPIDEIKDNDFNGKFLLDQHLNDFGIDTTQKYNAHIIGTVYDCKEIDNQIVGTVTFTDQKSIDKLDEGKKYLSAGYFYEPILEKGMSANGMPYDVKMTNIKANHVAHVDNPRYKDAVIGDSNIANIVDIAKAKAIADYVLINLIKRNVYG